MLLIASRYVGDIKQDKIWWKDSAKPVIHTTLEFLLSFYQDEQVRDLTEEEEMDFLAKLYLGD